MFGQVISAEDQTIVNAIVQGDKIESITVEGDIEALLASVPEVQVWNDLLDDGFKGLKPA